MEVHSDFVEPATPVISYNNVSIWRSEDSGYHTFTPGSVERSDISNENLQPSAIQAKICITGQIQVNYDLTPDTSYHLGRKYKRSNNMISSTRCESLPESPIIRRGVKRPYRDDTDEGNYSPIPTPTSMIAGGIQKLKVADNITAASELYHLNEYAHTLSYPTTPVKRNCRTSCKLSPMRRSNKKINFAIHSLSCEAQGLQPVIKPRPHSKVVRTIQFRPDQKVDIIKQLYENARVLPPLMKIFSYLTNEDIYNFSLVSPIWCQVWNQVSRSKKQDYKKFLKNAKENLENKNLGITPKNGDTQQIRSLKEVHNVINANMVRNSPRSPPGTPRTNKFKKFTKSASLDARLQLSCVRCHQPSKVTEEPSGEEWAECTSSSCSFQFCRFCKCDRHPGKHCFQYDLNGPSPSKRKRSVCAVGTKKSKKNLRRLL